MERVRPAGDRGEMAARLGGRAGLLRPEPVRRRAGRGSRARRTWSRCSRTRRASCTWGTRSTTRSATSSRTLRRRKGMQVLRPMGYDAFGLPAENAAIREGGHPRVVTERNIASIRDQMRRMGWAIDWSREISTHEPEYYRWTQWLFLRFYERGLAYRKEAPVKWCPNDQTVLANEQVIDGRCERCGAEVEAKNLTQWFFKITDYADALLDEMSLLEQWPERVLTMQRNWIGRSAGRPRRVPRRGAAARSCRSSRPGRTRCSARRSSCSRPSTRWCPSWSPAASTRRRCSTTSATRPPLGGRA